MSPPVTRADREAWLTRAERDLAAMRAWADEIERPFAALQSGCEALASIRSTDVEPKTAMNMSGISGRDEAFDG